MLFRVADRAGQTELGQHGLFLLAHPHGFQTAVLVVIAQQMQHRVHRQEGDFALQRMTIERGLFLCALHADDDIASILQPLFSSTS